jgi:hypothetical protein
MEHKHNIYHAVSHLKWRQQNLAWNLDRSVFKDIPKVMARVYASPEAAREAIMVYRINRG